METDPVEKTDNPTSSTEKGKPDKVFGSPVGYFRYNKDTARSARGYAGGFRGYFYSQGDPNAQPLKITEEVFNAWSPLEKFAYKHHSLYFFLGSAISALICWLAWYSYMFTDNPFYSVVLFALFIYPAYKFCQVLFTIEGESAKRE